MEGGYGGTGLDEVPELEGADEFDPFEVVECIEEIVKNVPEAPSETQWYHGRLDRGLAEDRLRLSGKLGSYLIRESDRRPGSYVLSFYGRTGMDHFKVTSVCGAFYIGGREFESLSLLIGYYTGWSDLLKGERLQHPVPPPEFVQPVFRKKRVQAISSYTKLPETDELSFTKGEMFMVHNDLGDDWVWVTSLLTDDSGIINQKLVQSIPDDVDPVEQFPWFHPSILKKDAADKLATSGPGSWLVKKSDSTDGDFSIYFYCKDQIQRFKIQRTTSGYYMGGRTFKSVSEVVKRYQNERIVEGFSLCKPVYRMAELPPDHGDSSTKEQQTSIKQSTGSNFFLNKKDIIVMKGRLNKKTQKTKKWKGMYFVLNGTEQQLYYFDSEKRSKPKGLIDLAFASIYPVHDTLFGRPNVFQVFSKGLNQASLCYLCADNVDVAQEWVRNLKSYCCNTRSMAPPTSLQQNLPTLTQLRSLRVKIFESSQHPPKHAQLYCVVSLNEFKVCRTRVVQGENCCWDEEFIIEDIPADINNFIISIHNKELIKDRLISSLKFTFSEVSSDKMIEDRFALVANSSTSSKGTLRIGYQYLHEKIMSLHEYAKLKELLLKNSMEVVLALTSTCDDYQDRTSLSGSLLQLFRHEKQEQQLLVKFLGIEMDAETEEGKDKLFRCESFGTTLMDQYMKMVSTTFLQHALQDTINKILRQMSETNASESEPSVRCIISHLNDAVHNISASANHVPTVLRHVCSFLQRKAAEKWPGDDMVRTRVISAFLFLRLICPALINPRQFNLITETPSQMAVKTLKQVAKCLNKLANLTEYKEAGMEYINQFIIENKKNIVAFTDTISNVQNTCVYPPCTIDVSRCLASIHRFCSSHLEKLIMLSHTQPSIANLVKVTENLTIRKRQTMKS